MRDLCSVHGFHLAPTMPSVPPTSASWTYPRPEIHTSTPNLHRELRSCQEGNERLRHHLSVLREEHTAKHPSFTSPEHDTRHALVPQSRIPEKGSSAFERPLAAGYLEAPTPEHSVRSHMPVHQPGPRRHDPEPGRGLRSKAPSPTGYLAGSEYLGCHTRRSRAAAESRIYDQLDAELARAQNALEVELALVDRQLAASAVNRKHRSVINVADVDELIAKSQEERWRYPKLVPRSRSVPVMPPKAVALPPKRVHARAAEPLPGLPRRYSEPWETGPTRSHAHDLREVLLESGNMPSPRPESGDEVSHHSPSEAGDPNTHEPAPHHSPNGSLLAPGASLSKRQQRRPPTRSLRDMSTRDAARDAPGHRPECPQEARFHEGAADFRFAGDRDDGSSLAPGVSLFERERHRAPPASLRDPSASRDGPPMYDAEGESPRAAKFHESADFRFVGDRDDGSSLAPGVSLFERERHRAPPASLRDLSASRESPPVYDSGRESHREAQFHEAAEFRFTGDQDDGSSLAPGGPLFDRERGFLESVHRMRRDLPTLQEVASMSHCSSSVGHSSGASVAQAARPTNHRGSAGPSAPTSADGKSSHPFRFLRDDDDHSSLVPGGHLYERERKWMERHPNKGAEASLQRGAHAVQSDVPRGSHDDEMLLMTVDSAESQPKAKECGCVVM